jgi:hypothetical protein
MDQNNFAGFLGELLMQLENENRLKTVCLVFDNLRAHKTEKVFNLALS